MLDGLIDEVDRGDEIGLVIEFTNEVGKPFGCVSSEMIDYVKVLTVPEGGDERCVPEVTEDEFGIRGDIFTKAAGEVVGSGDIETKC